MPVLLTRTHSEQSQCIIPALQELLERRLVLSPHSVLNRLERLDRTRELARLDDAYERSS